MIINLINYYWCHFYCIVFIIILCTVFDLTIVLTFVYLYCIVSFVLFVCDMCFFFSDNFMSNCCMTEFVDLRNDMHLCMYVCVCVHTLWEFSRLKGFCDRSLGAHTASDRD